MIFSKFIIMNQDNIKQNIIFRADRFEIKSIVENDDCILQYDLYDDNLNHINKLMDIKFKYNFKNEIIINKPIISLSNRNKILSVDFKYLYELIDYDINKSQKFKILNEIILEAKSFLQNKKNLYFQYLIGPINMTELDEFIKKNTYDFIYYNNQKYNNIVTQIENSLYFIIIDQNNSNIKFENFINNSCSARLIKIDSISINDYNKFVNNLNERYRKYITKDNVYNIIKDFISCININSRYINEYYGNIFLEDYSKELELWNNYRAGQ